MAPKAKTVVRKNTTLVEVAWEVCNQEGGIYTVIRSKVPTMVKNWGKNYFLIGPYAPKEAATDFEEAEFGHEVIDETLRILDALQTDELCPCNWKKGDNTL